MLPVQLRIKSSRSIAEMDSTRVAFGLNVKELGELCGPFSRSTYWRYLRQEVEATVAVELALNRVSEAFACAERDILERFPDPASAPVIRLLRFTDEAARDEQLALMRTNDHDEYLPFSAYCAMIGRIFERLVAAGYTAEVRFVGDPPPDADDAPRAILTPDPVLPEADAPPAGRQPRKRHYG